MIRVSEGCIFYSDSSDLVFDLEGSESLMIEHFRGLSAIKEEVSVKEVGEGGHYNEEDCNRIVKLALLFERLKVCVTKVTNTSSLD